MSWLNTFFSYFKMRERVDLTNSIPGSLEVITPLSHSDQSLLPGISKDPNPKIKVGSRGLQYFNIAGSIREWVPTQYDHVEVEILYDVESYFARATRAKLALFAKEGFEFVGNNDQTVEYIRERIRQIERATKVLFNILLLEVFRDLLVHCNGYILKVRKLEASGGKARMVGNKTIKPVAGYFRLPPETMVPQIDNGGNIVRWKQNIAGQERFFSVDDIQHFFSNRKAGYPLGIPDIIPAIDDIRALRSLEHSIDVLIHKHLFPIILWKVGTEQRPAQSYANGQTEIDIVKAAVANMPTEGSLVVSERYDVKAIGLENKALKVESYLNHFRDRLLAGLDVSSIDVGTGNSSSRSTAKTLSRNLVDVVKLKQIVTQEFTSQMIDELLLESTFNPSTVLDKENIVRLKFHEIDKESKQAEANHLVDLFNKQGISYPELRVGIGKEVLTEEEEKELQWNKFGREQALIGSVDELSGKGAEPKNNAVQNKNTPQNQHGKRSSTKLNHDSVNSNNQQHNPILAWHNLLGKSLQSSFGRKQLNLSTIELDVRYAYGQAIKEFQPLLHSKIRMNYWDPETINGLLKYCDLRAEKYIINLKNKVLSKLKNSDLSPNIIFSTLRYKTILIFESELSIAENVSKYRWFVKNGIDMKVVLSDNPCDVCLSKLTIIKCNDRLGEMKIPPFHPKCECRLSQT
jgi:hypothetical protein